METLVIKIKRKDKTAFTKELLKSLDFLEVKEENEFSEEEKRMVKNLYSEFKYVESSISKKKRLKTLQEAVDKL